LINHLKSKWQSFAIGLIGLYFIVLAFIFTPSVIGNYILLGMELNKSLIQIVQDLRIAAYILGFFIILFGIISAKWPALFSKSMDQSGRGIFDYKNIIIIIFSFIIIFTSLHIIVKLVRIHIQFDVPPFWPISNFLPQIPDFEHLFAAAAIIVIFYFFIKYLSRSHSRFLVIILFSIFLVMSTNLLQSQGWEGNNLIKNKGWDAGFVVPITGSSKIGHQYYHDAIKITDVVYFINTFEQMQPYLILHAKTHPPGATLTLYLLLKIFGNPALVSIVMGIFSVSLSTFFLYKILSIEFKEDLSKYMTFLFILIPSIQVFYVASIDALITTFLLGFLYFYLKQRSVINIICSIIFLFLSSFLTFAFVFILPVMVGYEILVRKDILRSGLIISGMGLIYAIIYIIFNFNYINSFMIASALENPHGFMLISEPATYLFTRIEGISEIIFYFGPFLSLLMVLGLHVRKRKNSHLLTLTWLAILSLLAMLGTGAFRTGETARAAIFVYPFLIFPVAIYLQELNISLKDRKILLYLVFTQTILMQTFGFYYW
jgi:hypothetical protein